METISWNESDSSTSRRVYRKYKKFVLYCPEFLDVTATGAQAPGGAGDRL